MDAGAPAVGQLLNCMTELCSGNVGDHSIDSLLQIGQILEALAPDDPLDPVEQPVIGRRKIRAVAWVGNLACLVETQVVLDES